MPPALCFPVSCPVFSVLHRPFSCAAAWFLALALTLPGCGGRPGSPAVAGAPQVSASGATGAAAFPSTVVVSVLYFDDRTGLPDLAWLRKGLADMLVGALAQAPSLIVVQRERLDEVLREQSLHLSGRVPDDSSVRAGRLTGATVLVTGSVAAARDVLRIDAQVIGVETGAILGTAAAEGRTSEVLAVAKSLVAKVVELLPVGEAKTAVATDGPGDGFVPAVQANERGELLSRQGKLFEALAEFERAMASDPGYSVARSNFARLVRGLSGVELLRLPGGEGPEADGSRIVARLVERLSGSGIQAEVAPARTEGALDGSVTLRIPVRLRLAPVAVESVVDAARLLGGTVRPVPQKDGPLHVRLSSRAEVNREFVRALGEPYRVYLRLLSGTGRTVAVYSGLREWRLSRWIAAVDDQQALVEADRVLETEAVVTGLTAEQAEAVASVRVTVDPVPRERATLRLDVFESDGSGTGAQGPDSPELRRIRLLRPLMEEAWNPPVAERTWGRGHLPANQRMALIGAVVRAGHAEILEEARLIRGSGEDDFDRAAMAAARAALAEWVRGADAAGRRGKSGGETKTAPPLKVRAQFLLVKDVPGLNLIGPEEAAGALVAERRPAAAPRAPAKSP